MFSRVTEGIVWYKPKYLHVNILLLVLLIRGGYWILSCGGGGGGGRGEGLGTWCGVAWHF